jgi:hypothetical protein
MTVGVGAEIHLAEGGAVESNEVVIFAQNETGETIYKCASVFIDGFDVPSTLPSIDVADADASMPAVGILYESIADGAAGRVIVGGMLLGADTDTGESWSAGDALYVNDSGTSASVDCAATLTSTKPANTDDSIQKMGIVVRAHATAGKIAISGAGRSNDVPVLEDDKFWLGNGTNVATAVVMSGDITMTNAGVTAVGADKVALGTDTTGNYAAGDAEGGSSLSGDTATAYFDAGTIEHEYGGLEADVNAYSGLVAISGGSTSEVDEEAEVESQIADVTNFLTENDASITFDGAIDFITSSDGNIDLSPNGTGEIDLNAAVNTAASENPSVVFKDSDAQGDDDGKIDLDCTTPDDGAEDCDIGFLQQVGGNLTERITMDADGTIWIDDLELTSSTDCSGVSCDGCVCWETDVKKLWVGDGSAPPTEIASGVQGAFTDASDPVLLVTTTKDVVIGAAQKNTSKFTVDGEEDEIVATFQGHSEQTVPILLVEDFDGANLFEVNDDQTVVIGGSTSSITGSGPYTEITDVLLLTPVASPPIACTTNAGIIYHDDSGTLCICDGASAWVLFADYGSGACS